jgi:hypothetical protein
MMQNAQRASGKDIFRVDVPEVNMGKKRGFTTDDILVSLVPTFARPHSAGFFSPTALTIPADPTRLKSGYRGSIQWG